MAAGRGLSDSVGRSVGPSDARAAVPLVHLLVPAPELHARPVQHAPLPRHRLPGGTWLQFKFDCDSQVHVKQILLIRERQVHVNCNSSMRTLCVVLFDF